MDITNIAAISSATVSILSRYLQEMKEGDTKVAELYDLIKKKFSTTPTTAELLYDFEKIPNDPDIQASMRVLIKKSISSDVEFASELESLTKSRPEFSKDILKQIEKILSSKSAIATLTGGALIGTALLPISTVVSTIVGGLGGLLITSLLESEAFQELVEKANTKIESKQVEK